MEESDEHQEWLKQETEAWIREGLIEEGQGQRILARYGLAGGESPRSLKRLHIVHIMAALGAVLVGVGVILIVGSNWEQMPRLLRLALLLASTGFSYGLGFRMAFEKKNYPVVGMALLLLGSLLWGAGIFLVAQMFHLSESGGEHTGLLYWFLGVLPLVYILRSPVHLILSLGVGSIWLLLTAEELKGWMPERIASLLLATGVVLYVLGILHRDRQNYRTLTVAFGWFSLFYLFLPLYICSFRLSWRSPAYYYSAYDSNEAALWLRVGILVLLGSLGAGWLLWENRRKDRVVMMEAGAMLFLSLMAAGLAGLVTVYMGPSGADHLIATILAVFFNLVLFAAAMGAIGLGWERSQPGLVNWGIFVFFVQLMTRYFDLLGRMLPGGLTFVGAGLLLIFGGLALEKQRKKLLQSIEGRQTA